MVATLDEFTDQLSSLGILRADELRTFVESLPPVKRPTGAQELARELVQAGRLTRFQAQCVWQGKGKALVLGEYVVLDKLGAGGMGQVFKAQHRRMKRLVAIKVLPAVAMKNAASIQRFQREVEAAARLIHPNIVTAFDASEHGGMHFLVMEFVDGRDLSHLLKEQGPLPISQAIDYILQAARGLAFAHGKGVVHRDIKPGNLLVASDGTVKILDMGLARFEDALATSADGGGEGLTQSGQIMGTIDYMAPEQAMNTRTADGRADIYSLGCTLYRLLTGANPYEGQSVLEKILAHRDKPIPLLTSARPDATAALDAVFQKMMAKQPEDRFQTMDELAAALEGLTKGQTPVAAVALPTAVPASSPSDTNLTNFFAAIDTAPSSADSIASATPAAASRTRPAVVKRSASKSNKTLLYLGGAGAAAMLVAGLLYASFRSSPQPESVANAAATVDRGEEATVPSVSAASSRDIPVLAVATNEGGPEVAATSLTSPLDSQRKEDIAPELLKQAGFDDPGRAPPELVAILPHPDQSRFRCLAFSPDSRRLAAGGSDAKIRVFDLADPQNVQVFDGHNASIVQIAFNGDGSLMASASGAPSPELKLWETATGREVRSQKGGNLGIGLLKFLSDGKTLASAGNTGSGNFYLWDLASGQRLAHLRLDEAVSYAIGVDGRALAVANADDTISVWSTRELQKTAQFNTGQRTIRASGLTVSADGRLLATGSDDRSIKVWGPQIGQVKATLWGHEKSLRSVDFDPTGRWLVSTSDDRDIRLWAIDTGELQGLWRLGDVNSAVFCPSGRYVATTHGAGLICILRVDENIRTAFSEQNSAGWVDLFNGRDLTGWLPMGVSGQDWTAHNGVLSLRASSQRGWLRSAQEYGDFELQLEFRLTPAVNSGVFLRSPSDSARPSHDGLEIAILDDHSDAYRAVPNEQKSGSVWGLVPVTHTAVLPTYGEDDWQSMHIRLVGSRLQVSINEQQVIDANLDGYRGKNPSQLGPERASGYIGLQQHGTEAHFRNIRIRAIEP